MRSSRHIRRRWPEVSALDGDQLVLWPLPTDADSLKGTPAHEWLDTHESSLLDEQAAASTRSPWPPGRPTAERGVRLVDGELRYSDEWL